MKKIFICAIIYCLTALATIAQDDIRIKQDGKDIIIEYDLEREAISVKLYVSKDDGKTFQGPMKQVSGDVGNVTGGQNKQIRWNVIKEWGELKGNVSFKLEKNLKKYYHKNTFCILNGAISNYSQLSYGLTQLSYGLTFGKVKRIGWYGSVLLGTSLKTTGDYESDLSGRIDEVLPFYSGKKSFSRLTVNAGGIVRLGKPIYLYAGIGYGYRNTFWQLDNDKWVKNTALSYSGISSELGVIFSLKNFVLSLGASAINLDYFDLKVGVGWNFRK